MTGKKIGTKKYCRSIEQVLEEHSSRKKKDKAVSFLENGSEKNTQEIRSRARLKHKNKHKIGLGKPRTIALSQI